MRFQRPSTDLETRLARNVGRLVSSSTTGEIAPDASEASFAAVQQRAAAYGRRQRRLQMGAVCAVAMLAGAGAYWVRARISAGGEQVITYRVDGTTARDPGNLISAPARGAPADVAFSDGTHIRMEPSARGRVTELDRRGARIALYDGRAHVDVRHRPDARWLFEAGPFEVSVHGTAFSLAWDAATAHFELRMESGVVSVTGPIAGGEMVLRAGETLSVGLGDRDDNAAAPAADVRTTPVEGAPAPAASDPVLLPAYAPPARSHSGAAQSRVPMEWRRQLADGKANAVVESAERRGIDRVLETASSEDLAALSDAARYVGRDDLARRALLAQRRRFPRSTRAAEALFLLGRLEGESTGGAARALTWYDHYLEEAPEGAYVSEALGREMMALEKLQRHDDATRIASDYVRRFPSGSYVHAARALIAETGRSSPRVSAHAP